MKIVLTAPATEMSEYNGNPAVGFSAGFPRPFLIPRSYLIKHLYKPVPKMDDLRVKYAPLGLRVIEASLIESGLFKDDDVAIVHPDDIEEAIGEDTKIVGVGVKDPLGLGYVSLTYSAIAGFGEPINKLEFDRLMKKLGRLRSKYRFHIVLGGPGVWQILRFGDPSKIGASCVIVGEGEEAAPYVFAKLFINEPVEPVVEGNNVDVHRIPLIKGASIYGAVEISRGCGRGCAFCSPTMSKRRDLPLDSILRNVKKNLECGQKMALLVTEDLFLYGSKIPHLPNEEAVLKLVESVASLRKYGLEKLQFTHLNLAAALYRRELFIKISEALGEFAWFKIGGRRVITTEVGIETGSAKLMKMHMAGKARPYKPEEWFNVVLESLKLLEDNNWAACATIIVGLPGETVEDAYETLKLVEEIDASGLRPLLIPLLFVPLGGCKLRYEAVRRFEDLMDVQVSIFAKCWRHNVKHWGPDHFAKYSSFEKTVFKLLALLYKYVVSKKRRWRRIIFNEVYGEVIKHLNGLNN